MAARLMSAVASRASRKIIQSNTTTTTTRRPCHIIIMQLPRRYNASAATSTGDDDSYVSPFQDFFDMIARGETSLGTEYKPPSEVRYLKCGVREDALRFKTVHYGRMLLPPHVQPGEHRVALKVFLSDLPLNDKELEVMKQIVTSRVNEERGELRLTSDQFGSRIENKRHLVSMLDRIVICSKQLAEEALQEES